MAGLIGNEIESTLTHEDEITTYTSEKNNVKDIDLGQIIDDKVAQETTRVKAEEVRLVGLTENEIEFIPTHEDETITYTFEKNNVKDIDLTTIDDKVAQETTRAKAEVRLAVKNSKTNRIYTNL